MELIDISFLTSGWLFGILIIAGSVLVGMLKWLRQEESTGLEVKSLKDYPRAVIQLDQRREVVGFNRAAARWAYQTFEFDLREAIGKPAHEAIAQIAEDWPEQNASGAETPQTVQLDHPSRPTQLVALPVDDDAPRGWYVEVHERADTSLEVKRVRTFYEDVLDHLPVELALLSKTGDYLYANQALGGANEVRQWLLGKTDFDYFDKVNMSPELALRRRSQRREVLQHGEPVTFTEQIPLPNGTAYYRRMYAPIFGDGDEIQALAFYGLDVTRQKLYAEEAARGREQFSRFSRLKSTFLQNLSHEFRTPISSMISAAEVISNEADAKLLEFAEIIEDNGYRLIHTLQNMSQLVKLEEDGIELKPRALDVAKKMRELCNRYRDYADRKGLYLKVKSERNELFSLVDEDALMQVGQALLDNAIKFTEEGGVLVEISTRKGQAHIQVMDTGIGMHEDFLSQLFEPFEQESDGLSRSFQGTGIGLHLVREIINQLDGEIRVSTEKGDGSTFTVQLPLPFGNEEEWPTVAVHKLGSEKASIIEQITGKYVHISQANSPQQASEADIVVASSSADISKVKATVPVLFLGNAEPPRDGDRPVRVVPPPFLQERILQSLVELNVERKQQRIQRSAARFE